MQCRQSGDGFFIVELGFHLLGGTGAAGALVLPRFDAGLQRLDPRFERSVLILELVDALTQGLFTRQAVGGRQRLAPELRGGEAGDEEGGQRNARQHGHPWRHGAV